MRSKLALVVAAGALVVAGAAFAQSADDLIKSKGCLTCHAADTKKVGPSWKDIAAKHGKDAKAMDMLVDKLKNGKGHAKASATDAELKTILTAVLATK